MFYFSNKPAVSRVFCFLVVANVLALTGDAVVGQPNDVLDSFGLNSGSIVTLEPLQHEPGESVSVTVQIEGRDYTLLLRPHTVRDQAFRLQVQLADGSMVERQPHDSRLLKGTVQGIVGSRVVGSLLETGLAAKIAFPDGLVYFVEPLASKLERFENETAHVVYRSSELMQHAGQCGVIDKRKTRPVAIDGVFSREQIQARSVARRQRRQKRGQNVFARGGSATLQVAEIAVDADFEYFLAYGTEQATVDRIELVIALVNDQYESEVNITHQITTVIVRTAETDPYAATDSSALLGEMQAEWVNNQQSVQRDIAHLFTGKDIDGNIIGIAVIGAICSENFGYGLSQSDFNGSLACATDLTAHELGHNWNSGHCDCPSNTMNPSITCANSFTTNTRQNIAAYRDSLDCLDEQTQLLLGDINLDGAINLLDVDPFIALLGNGGFQLEADINQDGVVNLLDVGPFIAIIGG